MYSSVFSERSSVINYIIDAVNEGVRASEETVDMVLPTLLCRIDNVQYQNAKDHT